MKGIKNAAPDAANIEDGKISQTAKTTLPLSDCETEKSMGESDLVEKCFSIAKRLPPEHLAWMARLVHSMVVDNGFYDAYKGLISEQGSIPTFEESNTFIDRWDAAKKREGNT